MIQKQAKITFSYTKNRYLMKKATKTLFFLHKNHIFLAQIHYSIQKYLKSRIYLQRIKIFTTKANFLPFWQSLNAQILPFKTFILSNYQPSFTHAQKSNSFSTLAQNTNLPSTSRLSRSLTYITSFKLRFFCTQQKSLFKSN